MGTQNDISPKLYPLAPIAVTDRSAERVAFITHERHIDALRASGDLDCTLLISCDWLIWQKCLQQNLNCVSIEEQIYVNPSNDTWQSDLLIVANEWVYSGATDMTLFYGASVGKLFNTQVAVALSTYLRMKNSIETVIQRYRVSEIIYFDFRTETNILNDELRQKIVCDIAAKFGVKVFLKKDPISRSDPSQAMVQEGKKTGAVQSPLLKLATLAMTYVVNLAGVWRRQKRRALILIQTPMAMPLLKESNPSSMRPLLLPEMTPKSPINWLKYIHSGVFFMLRKNAHLSDPEKNTILKNVDTLMSGFSDELTSYPEFLRTYVKSHIIDSGQFFDMARQVKNFAIAFEREKPTVVLVDGIKNFPNRTCLDLSRTLGGTSHYIWHAPLSSEYYHYDAFGHDHRQPVTVDKMLAWGKMDQSWLKALNVHLKCQITGAPHLKLAASVGLNETQTPDHSLGRVLFLDCAAVSMDLFAASSTRYEFFINMVRHLKKMGVNEIIYKLHPGRANKAYFEKIAEHFEIGCRICKAEPIENLIDWADFVIGPVISSAMMKVVLRNKPYYPVLLKPTVTNDECYSPIPINYCVDDLDDAIRNQRHAGGIDKLDFIASWKSISNPGAVIWNILADDSY